MVQDSAEMKVYSSRSGTRKCTQSLKAYKGTVSRTYMLINTFYSKNRLMFINIFF